LLTNFHPENAIHKNPTKFHNPEFRFGFSAPYFHTVFGGFGSVITDELLGVTHGQGPGLDPGVDGFLEVEYVGGLRQGGNNLLFWENFPGEELEKKKIGFMVFFKISFF